MKKVVFAVTLFFIYFSSVGAAEEKDWVLKGIFGVVYNQTSVSENWSGSEKNSKNWGLKLDASAEKGFAKSTWSNNLKEEFGKSEVSDTPEQVSADLIDFSSVLMYNWSIYADPYVGFNVITVHNTFHDPVTYKESAGIGWAFLDREKQHLKLRVGAAYTQRFQSDADTTRETGLEAISNYDVTLSQTVKFASEARLFTAFKEGPNLRWDNNLYLKVSKYVTVALNYLELYDAAKQTKPQWAGDIETRFTVAVALSYNLF
ncbi:MAG: DUF481 domain-containing protein [Endomicrobiales bacterium]|nr:DUF481 domain-containing protein [Endomicrobiales bacterium]